MAINEYEVGDVVELTAAFTNKAGAAADPTVTTFKVRKPDNTVLTKVYGTDVEVVRDSVGAFHWDYTIDQAFRHYCSVKGTGANARTKTWSFTAKQVIV